MRFAQELLTGGMHVLGSLTTSQLSLLVFDLRDWDGLGGPLYLYCMYISHAWLGELRYLGYTLQSAVCSLDFYDHVQDQFHLCSFRSE